MPEQIPVRSVRTGGIDHMYVPTPEEAQVEALRRERDGYVRRGLDDRAEQVAAELRRLGAEEAAGGEAERVAPAAPPLENAAENAPRQRTARGRK
ncbi:hypothetical protein ACFFMN_33930 [Planobispora siamensis]|uniref:Uncharacterized protein n=1 Tax=Planobispora siamensis TaxID=936338 RepID=A0A8J3SC49_9ACTN|nr:hypothetical protein [Planobispora siamensis]GIH91946.1 hypothetical protein Psi01_25760 [Planobispora siamensis]